ncbi:hypothetical protein [Nocardioides terrisoli]|uniref:hypothetical protein n=1 Tax=Nocardioides terrisoli TaxID=3388267 RepID=UPI00287B78A4|nr:hypothetical protein [Nocardioides marmorisolisilvae]
MNDQLTELRQTLRGHAEAVDDQHHPERIGAVRRRVTVARRRRTAGIAIAAALVVAAGVTAVSLPHDSRVQPAEAPARMVGHVVPRTTMSLGATYRYVRGYEAKDGRLAVQLPASVSDYLVRMGSADPHGQLSLSQAGASDEWVTSAGEFGEFFEVSGQEASRLTVRQRGGSGPVAMAVYRFAQAAPGSYQKAGIVFAPTAAGQPLLGAWIGDPGQAVHTLRFDALPAQVDLRAVCSHLPHGTQLKIAFVGRPGYVSEGAQCGQAPEHLPGENSGVMSPHVPRGVSGLRISVVDRHDHPVPVPSSTRIGLGVYQPASTGAVHGLQRFIDDAGHRWKLSQTYVAPRGQRRASATIDGRQPALVAFGSPGRSRGVLTTTLGNSETSRFAGGGMSWAVVADGRDDTRLRMHFKNAGPTAQLVIGTYQLAD